MNLKILLIVALALASPFGCTRIVKHYHYHFGGLSFPVDSKQVGVKRAIDEFLSVNRDTLNGREREFLKFAKGCLAPEKDLFYLSNPKTLSVIASETGFTCQEAFDLYQRVGTVYLGLTVRMCNKAKPDSYSTKKWRRQKLLC